MRGKVVLYKKQNLTDYRIYTIITIQMNGIR